MYWPLFKYFVLFVFYYTLNFVFNIEHKYCILSMIMFVSYYQDVVAAIFGLSAIPAMDQGCFLSSSKANVNFGNCTMFERHITREELQYCCRRIAKDQPKCRYRIECVYGDYYYKEMDLQEALDKAIIINTDPAREP